MKTINLFSLLVAFAMISMVACKSDSAATATADDTRAVPATTSTTQATPGATPGAAAADAVPTGPLTSINIIEDTHDFGEIMEGEKVIHEYKFKNTGEEPLIISNCKGSCGCTVPDWPRDPIAPGAESVIKVQFDSKGKGKVGGNLQSKRVTITANTDPANSYLTIKGKVNKEEGAEEAKK